MFRFKWASFCSEYQSLIWFVLPVLTVHLVYMTWWVERAKGEAALSKASVLNDSCLSRIFAYCMALLCPFANSSEIVCRWFVPMPVFTLNLWAAACRLGLLQTSHQCSWVISLVNLNVNLPTGTVRRWFSCYMIYDITIYDITSISLCINS